MKNLCQLEAWHSSCFQDHALTFSPDGSGCDVSIPKGLHNGTTDFQNFACRQGASCGNQSGSFCCKTP